MTLLLTNGIMIIILAHLSPSECMKAEYILNQAFYYERIVAFCEYTTEDIAPHITKKDV